MKPDKTLLNDRVAIWLAGVTVYLGLGELTGIDEAGGLAQSDDGWKHATSCTFFLLHTNALTDLPLFFSNSIHVFPSFHLSNIAASPTSHALICTRSYVLVRVVDVELLQEQAVVQEAVVHLGEELEDDAFLRSQEDHCLVLMGTCLAVHHDACQAVPGTRSLIR